MEVEETGTGVVQIRRAGRGTDRDHSWGVERGAKRTRVLRPRRRSNIATKLKCIPGMPCTEHASCVILDARRKTCTDTQTCKVQL